LSARKMRRRREQFQRYKTNILIEKYLKSDQAYTLFKFRGKAFLIAFIDST
jgi:hypothetical protein